MNDDRVSSTSINKKTASNYWSLIVVSLVALFATFLVSTFDYKFQTKFFVFFSIIVGYLLVCLVNYKKQAKAENFSIENSSEKIFDEEVERKLHALEEVNQFFGASLKSEDMFRLLANRVSEILPFADLTLFSVEKGKSKLRIAQAVGENAAELLGAEISSDAGIAGAAFQNAKMQFSADLQTEKTVLAAGDLKNVNSAIAAPLAQSGNFYGVLVLYSAESDLNLKSRKIFEAVAERIAPLFANTRVVEENLSNSMVDALTNLPNERAFYLILENQIAESQRFRDERALTVLAIDVKNFSELNLRYGHSTGDCLLADAAEKIKSQLRDMDFLARVAGDEFLAVLPTASEQTAAEIVRRIERTFVSKPFEISKTEKINLELKFGAASFWHDGETAEDLLRNARLRKSQSKTSENSNILWFPKEYVN